MRTFAKMMNTSNNEVCPICKTQDKGKVVLIGIVGTQQDNIIEAQQFHLKCIELYYDKTHNIIYQVIK